MINSATHIGVAQHTSGEDAPTLSVEETARQRIVQLTGNSLCGASVCSQRDPLSERHKYMYTVHADLWTECVTAGALRDASLIMSRHLSDALSADSGSSFLSSSAMISAFKSIPESVPPSDIVVWFRSDVLPRLHRWAEDPAFQMSGTGTLGALLVAELCRRASLSADLLFHPFEAILAADLAVTLSSSFTHTGEVDTAQGLNSDKIIDIQSRTLLLNLQIQAAVWRNWGDRNRPSILDVADLGLRGLVRERLWDLRDIEEEIVSDVTYVIEPVLVEFGERLDDVLQQWLQDAVEQRVVLIDGNAGTRAIQGNSDRGRDRVRDSRGIASNAHDQEDDEEDTTCSLSRLVSVVSLIKDPHRRVTSLLLLFQVPAVDVNEERPVAVQQSDSPLSNNSASDDPRGHSEGTIDRLCALAQAVCPLVEPVSSEALREAMRLHRIKTLAASYGVVSFDPRDRHQIRAVASVIALKAERTHALRDAMEFASSWGTDSADLSGTRPI